MERGCGGHSLQFTLWCDEVRIILCSCHSFHHISGWSLWRCVCGCLKPEFSYKKTCYWSFFTLLLTLSMKTNFTNQASIQKTDLFYCILFLFFSQLAHLHADFLSFLQQACPSSLNSDQRQASPIKL